MANWPKAQKLGQIVLANEYVIFVCLFYNQLSHTAPRLTRWLKNAQVVLSRRSIFAIMIILMEGDDDFVQLFTFTYIFYSWKLCRFWVSFNNFVPLLCEFPAEIQIFCIFNLANECISTNKWTQQMCVSVCLCACVFDNVWSENNGILGKKIPQAKIDSSCECFHIS